MKHFTLLVVAVVLLFADPGRCETGVSPPPDGKPNVIFTTVGFDSALVTWELGYGRFVPIRRPNRLLLVFGGFGMPMTKPDINDYVVRLGARTALFEYRGFGIPCVVNLLVRGTKNDAFRATGIGSVLGLTPGYFSSAWFAAVEVLWDQQWTTYLKHTQKFRNISYADAKDGWYRMPAFTMRYGVRVGYLVKQFLEITLRGGYEQLSRYDTENYPFYAILGVNFRL